MISTSCERGRFYNIQSIFLLAQFKHPIPVSLSSFRLRSIQLRSDSILARIARFSSRVILSVQCRRVCTDHGDGRFVR